MRGEAWPDVRSADEMHEALNSLGFLTVAEAEANPGWAQWLLELSGQRRAGCLACAGSGLWLAAERLPAMRMVHPAARVPARSRHLAAIRRRTRRRRRWWS
ncbi:hypothetical protein G039_0330200 [Pseudomonas aeruginosa VRFPA01]|nr:hypothetical protein G039_0330200 [Pseudomonas aeruginosa VRFPA01]